MEKKKYKLLTISDMPLSTTGVARQTRYTIEHLLRTGMFKVISIGAAIKHKDHRPIKTEEWKDDWTIIPCDGFVNKDLIRQVIDIEKPDCLFIMNDPRFFVELFQIENEIRQQCPIVWNTIWDNYLKDGDLPTFNKPYYDSCDFLGCINKLTFEIMKELGLEHKAKYIPHGIPKDEYKILYDVSQEKLKMQLFDKPHANSFILFYNSRNALRKRTGNALMAFREFRRNLPEEEQKRVLFAMHTPPKDPEGLDLFRIVKDFGMEGSVVISDKKIPDSQLCEFYNAADVLLAPSSEEGFGLSVCESLMCGTPVICTKTGGMQDQVIDEEMDREFGFCLEPQARSLIGSQQISLYLWQDHLDPFVVSNYINTLYQSWKKDRTGYKSKWAGEEARASMLRRFNLEEVQKIWEQEIVRTIEEHRQKKENRSVQVSSI